MKCIIFILLISSGWVYGLQAPLHYKYKYFGSVSNGISELSSRASGWAMKADINVYILKNDGEAVFEIHNIKMVDFFGDLKCDSRGDIADDLFKDIADSSLKYALETPFKAHLFRYEDFALEYVEDEFIWLINVRKGIVSIFRNEILRGNIENQVSETTANSLHEGHVVNVFSVDEETLFGKCTVHYTLHPIPEYLAGKRNRYLEEYYEQDIQRKAPESSAYTSKTLKKTSKKFTSSSKKVPQKTSKTPAKYQRSDIPEIKDGLWHVVRSVDFDKCTEPVGLQANIFDISSMNVGQHDWRRSSSSVSEFIFRGSAGHFRLEKVVVEGARTMLPYGFKTELLQSKTNQTLQLISVETMQAAPYVEGNLKHSKTWMFEYLSPVSSPKDSKLYPWVVYTAEEGIRNFQIYGIKRSSEDEIKYHKEQVIEHVFQTVQSLFSEDLGQPFPSFEMIVTPLKIAITHIKELSKEEILAIFKEVEGSLEKLKERDVFKDDSSVAEKISKIYRQLIIDVAASSGTYDAYEAILEYAKAGNVAAVDMMTTFMTLTSNAEGPANIPSMMNYVTTLDLKNHPITSSTILINFAYFLNKMCLNPQAKTLHYYGALSGDKGCQVDLIKEKFIPFLENIIFNDEFTREKYAAIIALRHLGSSYGYSILTSVIREDRMKFPVKTRVFAIESLDARILYMYNLREPVMNLLTEIYTNVGEDLHIREAAVKMIILWGPEGHFFHRLAKMSWNDPSRQFASFLTSLIETIAHIGMPEVAKLEQAASHALKFARPVAPTIKYTYLKSITSNYIDKYITIHHAAGWLTSDKSSEPESYYFGMFSNFGGFQGNQIEIEVQIESLISTYKDLFETDFTKEGGKIEGIAAKVAEDFYDNIEETVATHLTHIPFGGPGDVHMSLIQHMKYFIPNLFDRNFIPKMPENSKNEINFAKLLSTINVKSVYPNELGLPVFLEIFAPILSSFVGDLQFHRTSGPTVEAVGINLFSRLIEECHSSIEVLLPWNKTIVGVHTLSSREVNIPLKVTVDDESQYNRYTRLRFHLQSSVDKFPLIRANSLSLVTHHPMHRTSDSTNWKFAHLVDPLRSKTVQIPSEFTGLDLRVNFASSLEFPFTQHKIHEILRNPGLLFEAPFMPLSFIVPTLKSWQLSIDFDASSSQTKNVSIEFSKGKFGKSENESLIEEALELSQYSQQGFEEYEQEQQGLQKGFEEYEQEQQGLQQGFEEGFQEVDGSSGEETAPYLRYEDFSYELRDKKLQTIYGGPGFLKSVKLNLDGKDHRSYEILLTSAKSKQSESRRHKKSGVTFIRSPIPNVDSKPALVCVNYEAYLPSYSRLYDFKDYSSDDLLQKSTKIDVTLQCTGEPILVLEGSYKMSKEWASKLQDELPKYCDYDRFDEIFSLDTHAVYDDVKFDLNWKEICDHRYHLTSKTFQLLEHFAERLSNNQCYTEDDYHKVHVEVQRSPATGNWDIKVLQDNSEETFNQIPHNHIFNRLFSAGKKTSLELHPEIHSLSNWESDKCIVGVDSVRTYDGYTYGYKPSQCWSVASKVCNKEKGPMLLVRSSTPESTSPEIKSIDVQKGLVIEYSYHEVKVNGKIVDPVDGKEIIKDQSQRTLVTIIKQEDFFMAKFDGFYISVKNGIITAQASVKFAGMLCGMCGNFNGEPEDDLIGPHQCPYSDSNMFVASWTGRSDKCDLYSLLELREGAENYQKQCTTMETLYKSRPRISQQCYYSARMVLELENGLCMSQSYLLYCKTECAAIGHSDKQETFLCWSKDNAPPSLKEASSSEVPVIHIGPEEKHQYATTSPIKIPTGCLPAN